MAESKVKSWLDDKAHGYIYTTLSATELIRIWRSERNTMTGVMAADEVMRRLDAKGHISINGRE